MRLRIATWLGLMTEAPTKPGRRRANLLASGRDSGDD